MWLRLIPLLKFCIFQLYIQGILCNDLIYSIYYVYIMYRCILTVAFDKAYINIHVFCLQQTSHGSTFYSFLVSFVPHKIT